MATTPKQPAAPKIKKKPVRGKNNIPEAGRIHRKYSEEEEKKLTELGLTKADANTLLNPDTRNPSGRTYSEVPLLSRMKLLEALENNHFDIIQEYLDLYPNQLDYNKVKMLENLMSYVYPKLKMIDIGSIGDNNTKLEIVITQKESKIDG